MIKICFIIMFVALGSSALMFGIGFFGSKIIRATKKKQKDNIQKRG